MIQKIEQNINGKSMPQISAGAAQGKQSNAEDPHATATGQGLARMVLVL